MRALAVIASLLLGACDSRAPANQADLISINPKYWVCTSSHTSHHAAVEMGMKIKRQFPAYDSTECDQWSAIMTRCGPLQANNMWCAQQAQEMTKVQP